MLFEPDIRSILALVPEIPRTYRADERADVGQTRSIPVMPALQAQMMT